MSAMERFEVEQPVTAGSWTSGPEADEASGQLRKAVGPALRNEATSVGKSPGVPAVLHAVAIMQHLRANGNRPQAMMEIARALRINNSTCFNILRTLARARLLEYESDTRKYTLGSGLVDLASMVEDHGQLLNSAVLYAERVAAEVHECCLVLKKANDDSFLVVGRADGPGGLKLTAAIGDRLPPYGAVLSKAYYAWCGEDEINHMLSAHGLPARTESSITGYSEFKLELERTRRRGYSTSVGEYYDEYNAVGVPILNAEGRPSLVLVVTGLASRIPPRQMPFIGGRLRRASLGVTRAVYGTAPGTNLRIA
jgi:DNA-binding IclR family transcriptional regulator